MFYFRIESLIFDTKILNYIDMFIRFRLCIWYVTLNLSLHLQVCMIITHWMIGFRVYFLILHLF